MKRLKAFSVLCALLGSWHCGGDGGSGPVLIQNVGPPAPPAQLRVDKLGDGEVWLNWQAAGEEGDLLYIVYRAVADSGAAALDSTFRTSFQDRGLEYDLEYTYYVTALNIAGGESAPSNAVTGQPFTNLKAKLSFTLTLGDAAHQMRRVGFQQVHRRTISLHHFCDARHHDRQQLIQIQRRAQRRTNIG